MTSDVEELRIAIDKIVLFLNSDFGLAQFLSPEEKNSSLRGSPLYMAPEILLNNKYDARVDLWSVGVIMFECLFGKAPYSSKGFEELTEYIKAQAPIQVPHGSAVSSLCKDLLTRLLQHNPEKRISYEEFFQHPFLDLEHAPTTESYETAVSLVCDAVKCDANKEFVEAYSLYCEALKYFIPLVNNEADAGKKVVLRSKVASYVKRAEDLKKMIYDYKNGQLASSQSTDMHRLRELNHLCNGTPAVADALEIGNAAEQYMAEGQYRIALEKFEVSLGVLVSALKKEPKGYRRDLLHLQTQHWLKVAEIAKTFLNVEDESEQSTNEVKEWCRMQ